MAGLASSSPAAAAAVAMPFRSRSSTSGIKWCRASSLPDYPPASKIFVRNLSYFTGEATLIKTFSRFGQIVDVRLAKHEDTKRSKGYAFIQFSCQDDALLAMEEMDQQMIDGRVVYTEIAKPLHGGSLAYPRTMGPPSQQHSDENIFGHSQGWY